MIPVPSWVRVWLAVGPSKHGRGWFATPSPASKPPTHSSAGMNMFWLLLKLILLLAIMLVNLAAPVLPPPYDQIATGISQALLAAWDLLSSG